MPVPSPVFGIAAHSCLCEHMKIIEFCPEQSMEYLPRSTAARIRCQLLRLHERLLGRDTFQLLDRLHPIGSDISETRLAAARDLLRHARSEIPFWQSRLKRIDPDVFTWDDLDSIPVLTRGEVVCHREQMRWLGPGKELVHKSGGTTDDNLTFYWGRQRQSWDRATRMRGLAKLGIHPGDRVLHIWPREPRSVAGRFRRGIRKLRDTVVADPVVDPRPWTDASLERLLKVIDRFRPQAIIAYPSWLMRIARFMEARSRRIEGIADIILTCGEVLFDHQRTYLEEIMQAPVFQEYGSQDAGLIAHEDSDKVLRLNPEPMAIEILRGGRRAEPGELGEVVVTHFFTPRMPFIRYATGDVARALHGDVSSLTSQPAICPLPEGRTSDLLLSELGELVATRPIIESLMETTGATLFSLYQPNPESIHVLCVPQSGVVSQAIANEVLQSHLGKTVTVIVQQGESFQELRSGKHRFVCSPVAASKIAHDTFSGQELSRSWPQQLEPAGWHRG